MLAGYTNRVELVLGINLIFLNSSIENLLIGVIDVTVGVHELNNHVLRNNGLGRKILGDDVVNRADRLTCNTHINLCDGRLELLLQTIDNVGQTLSSLVDVVNNTLADER